MDDKFRNMMDRLKDTSRLTHVNICEHNKLPESSYISYSVSTAYSKIHDDNKFANFLSKVIDYEGTVSSTDEITDALFDRKLVNLLLSVKYTDDSGDIHNVFHDDIGDFVSAYKSKYYDELHKEIDYIYSGEYKKHPNYKLIENINSDPNYMFTVMTTIIVKCEDEYGDLLPIHTSNFFDKETNLLSSHYGYQYYLATSIVFENYTEDDGGYILFNKVFPDFKY